MSLFDTPAAYLARSLDWRGSLLIVHYMDKSGKPYCGAHLKTDNWRVVTDREKLFYGLDCINCERASTARSIRREKGEV